MKQDCEVYQQGQLRKEFIIIASKYEVDTYKIIQAIQGKFKPITKIIRGKKHNMEKDNDMNLEYNIIDRDAYGKEIDNIKQKNTNKKWEALAQQSQVEFTLEFKNPSFVTRIESRGHESYHADLTFKDMDGDPVHTLHLNFLDRNINIKNVSISSMVATVTVKLTSGDGKSKKMGMNFLLFKGSSTGMIKPTKEKPTNVSKEQTVKLDTLPAPIRSKTTGVSQPYNHLRSYLFYDRTKKMVKPKPEEKKPQSKQNQDINIDNFSKQDSDTLMIEPQRDFEFQELGDLMDCLMYVNEDWLEAQRKMEEKMGVPEDKRLSSYVKAIQLANKP